MTDHLLDEKTAASLRERPLTYPEVAATREVTLPAGYHHVSRSARLGRGQEQFDSAATALFGWELQRRAGVRVLPTTTTVTNGGDAVLLLGFGQLAIRAPVRVVYVVDEPQRRGFAYGTLGGHPESGEECFLVELTEDGDVTCRITAFSKPATWLTRLGGPVARLTQRWVTGRYLAALAQK